jgi:hypothetical protein
LLGLGDQLWITLGVGLAAFALACLFPLAVARRLELGNGGCLVELSDGAEYLADQNRSGVSSRKKSGALAGISTTPSRLRPISARISAGALLEPDGSEMEDRRAVCTFCFEHFVRPR